MKARMLLAGGVLFASMASMNAALAETQFTAAATAPVAVGNVSVQACSGDTCQTTPPLASVGLRVGAFAETSATPPSITEAPCPSGAGTTLVVNGGAKGAIVTAILFGTRPDGSPYEQAVGFPVVLPADATTAIRGCA